MGPWLAAGLMAGAEIDRMTTSLEIKEKRFWKMTKNRGAFLRAAPIL
jgi:hypothetical protein